MSSFDDLMKFLSENEAKQTGKEEFTLRDIYPRPDTYQIRGIGWKRRIEGKGVSEWQRNHQRLRSILEALEELGFVLAEVEGQKVFYRLQPEAYSFMAERYKKARSEAANRDSLSKLII